SGTFCLGTAVLLSRTIPEFRCARLEKIGPSSFTAGLFRTAKNLENTINKRSPRFIDEILRHPNSDLLSGTGGKRSAACSFSRATNSHSRAKQFGASRRVIRRCRPVFQPQIRTRRQRSPET